MCRYSTGFWDTATTILSAVVIDFLLVGWGIATVGWCAACQASTGRIVLLMQGVSFCKWRPSTRGLRVL